MCETKFSYTNTTIIDPIAGNMTRKKKKQQSIWKSTNYTSADDGVFLLFATLFFSR